MLLEKNTQIMNSIRINKLNLKIVPGTTGSKEYRRTSQSGTAIHGKFGSFPSYEEHHLCSIREKKKMDAQEYRPNYEQKTAARGGSVLTDVQSATSGLCQKLSMSYVC